MDGLDKTTKLPPLTIGFALMVAAFLLYLGGEIRHAQTTIEDVRDRQTKYIGQDGTLTRQFRDMEREIARLRERVVVLETT